MENLILNFCILLMFHNCTQMSNYETFLSRKVRFFLSRPNIQKYFESPKSAVYWDIQVSLGKVW